MTTPTTQSSVPATEEDFAVRAARLAEFKAAFAAGAAEATKDLQKEADLD